KRETPDSEPMYFELKTDVYEKMAPPEMALSFYDTKIESFNLFDAIKLELLRGAPKDQEKFLLEREQPKDEKDKKDKDKKEEKEPDKKDKKEPEKKEAAKEEIKTFKLLVGNKSRNDRDKEGVYAMVEGSDLVFVMRASTDKTLKDAEFRDRQVMKFDAAQAVSLQGYILDKEEVEVRDPLFERGQD